LLQIQKEKLTQKNVNNYLSKHYYSKKESFRDYPFSFEVYFRYARMRFKNEIIDSESNRKLLKKFVKKWINNNWGK